MVISLVLASETEGYDRGAGISLDAEGHSELVADYTVWLLSSPVQCKEIPQPEIWEIREAWGEVSPGPHEAGQPIPRPYLYVVLDPGGSEEHFYVRPAALEENPALLEAARLTMDVFVRAYGDRLVRELRFAGLESLLPVQKVSRIAPQEYGPVRSFSSSSIAASSSVLLGRTPDKRLHLSMRETPYAANRVVVADRPLR